MTRKILALAGLLGAIFIAAAAPASAQEPKLVFALPGLPPIYLNVIAYVAEKEGFFKQYGADVELRQFDTGAAGSRAVIAGDADLALVPTALMITQIANANVDVVAIWGLPNPDWAIGTTNAAKASCADLKGQQIGVDTPGGARSLALKDMLPGCGLSLADVQQVGLGSNTAAAMVAGQLAYGVLHLDDAPEIESHGKKVTIVTTLASTDVLCPVARLPFTYCCRDRLGQGGDDGHLLAVALDLGHIVEMQDAVGELARDHRRGGIRAERHLLHIVERHVAAGGACPSARASERRRAYRRRSAGP